MTMPLFDRYMSSREHSHLIGPSSLHACIRAHAYAYTGAPITDAVDKSAADFSTMMHLGYSQMIHELFPPEEHDADVEIDWGGPRPGSADSVDYVNKVVTDLKVPGGRAFQWMLDHGVKADYASQLMVYAHGLTLKHGGDWTCRLYLINRDDPSQRHTFEFPYDEERALVLVAEANQRHEALAGAAAVAGMTATDEEKYLLAEQFPREGRSPDTFPSSWCPWRTRCWPQPDNPDQTTLSAEIVGDDPVILGHARQYLTASAESKRWKDQADEHREYLKGLPGTYADEEGAVRISMIGGNERPDVPNVDAMVGILDQLGLDVPMKPQQPSTRYTKVERAVPKKKR